MVSRVYFAVIVAALLAVAGNAVLPFAVGADAGIRDGKILICTAEGYRYIDAGSVPVTPHKPHCLLCVLAALNIPVTPPLAVSHLVSLKQLAVIFLPETRFAIPRVPHTLFISRAPPVLS